MTDPTQVVEQRNNSIRAIGRPEAALRKASALAISVLMFLLVLDIRGWDWGFQLAVCALPLLFMPIVWALWPTIAWRRNTLGYCGVGMGVLALFMALLGINRGALIGNMSEASSIPVCIDGPGQIAALVFTTFTVGMSLLGLALMSKHRQRLLCFGSALLPMLVAELFYGLEERRFENEKRDIVAIVEPYRQEHQSYPNDPEFEAAWQEQFGDTLPRLEYSGLGSVFMLYAARPVNPSCGVRYHSTSGWTGHD